MKKYRERLYPVFVLVVVSAIFLAYLSIANLDEFPGMLEGTASRPYVYRVLVPAVAKATAILVPSPVVRVVRKAPVLSETFRQLGGERYPGEAVAALSILFLALLGFVLAEQALLRDLGYNAQEQSILPVSVAVMALPLSTPFAYIYDLPQVFLFALGLLYLYRRNWPAYLAVLATSLLNKETSVFLIIVFALYYFSRLPHRQFATLLGIQAALFLAIRTVITYIFRNNSGIPIFWSLAAHIAQYVKAPSTFLVTVGLLGGIVLLMVNNWSNKPVFLRYAASAFLAALVLFFVAGMPGEFRVFLDVLPVFGILLFPQAKGVQAASQHLADPRPQ